MESEEPGGAAALSWTDSGWPDAREIPAADSAAAVATLYQNHAVGLIRLAYLMLGDRAGAEDAVQDAFCGLYRHWDRLTDQDPALAYVRTVVAVQELYANGNPVIGQRLVKFGTATGKLAQTLFTQPVKSGYSEILWTNASGSVLVVSLVTKGNSMGIFHGNTYTPIPWSRTIATAAW